MAPVRTETPLGTSTLVLETGKLAKQADGAVLVRQGDTVIMATAVMAAEPRPGYVDFVPLSVDYREKTYAAGKIPGGFFKREGRPTEKETLTARLIDRPIRPLFPNGLRHEVQIMVSVLSADGQHDPDVLSILGASVAIGLSPMQLHQTLSAVRVGRVNDAFILNPTVAQLADSSLDVVVVGTREGIIMIESELQEVSEDMFLQALQHGYEHVLKLLDWQETFIREAGVAKQPWDVRESDPRLAAELKQRATSALERINGITDKRERHAARTALTTQLTEQLNAQHEAWTAEVITTALHDTEEQLIRRLVLDTKRRPDGRQCTDIRALSAEVGVLPRTHGSGLFTRGQTQSLSTTTLGTGRDEQMIEALEGKSYKSFMLHYNFPPFSVGEARPARGPGRREIGHGALAERALRPVMPTKEQFPYVVRVVSEILESNGSSSMASVCAATLALLDAGVPVKAAVAGVAMGMVSDETRHVILTDIAGLEDHYGDMDFKVAGTRQGVTAVQLDVKRKSGLTPEMVRETLTQAHAARAQILDVMDQVIAEPRSALSAYAPRITVIKIDPSKIGEVIGPGGKTIRKIIEQTGASIDVEDDGSVAVASADGAGAEKAVQIIRDLTAEVEVGKVYQGTVTRLMNFGAFCEVLPGKEGLIHVSELDHRYVEHVEDVVKVGDQFDVKVIEVDAQHRINLSRKALLTPPPGTEQSDNREQAERRPDRSRDRGPRRGSRPPDRSDRYQRSERT